MAGKKPEQPDIDAVVEMGSKTLFPVHTEHPETYNKVSKNLVLTNEGQEYELKF